MVKLYAMVDPTSLWSYWQKNKEKTVYVVIGILLFAAGWQLGRVMSPYYAAHPIVFQEGGGGVAQPANFKALGPTAQPKPTVAGSATQATSGAFVGSINSDKYHDPSCPSASRIKPENQVWFSSIEEAQQSGYVPSQCTAQLLGI